MGKYLDIIRQREEKESQSLPVQNAAPPHPQPIIHCHSTSWPQVGEMVTWDSPLFGRLRGAVLDVFPHAVTVVHPLAHEGAATIPKAWLIETEEA